MRECACERTCRPVVAVLATPASSGVSVWRRSKASVRFLTYMSAPWVRDLTTAMLGGSLSGSDWDLGTVTRGSDGGTNSAKRGHGRRSRASPRPALVRQGEHADSPPGS